MSKRSSIGGYHKLSTLAYLNASLPATDISLRMTDGIVENNVRGQRLWPAELFLAA